MNSTEIPYTEFGSANADPALTLAHTNKLLEFLEESQIPAMLIDIDGVILDNNHRLHHIVCTDAEGHQQPRPDPDWESFHSQAALDTPGVYTDLVRELVCGGTYAPVFLTARVEIWTTTRETLALQLEAALKCSVSGFSIVMRERKSSFSAPEFKTYIATQMKSRGIKIGLAVDDSHANCLEFRALGIPTLRAYNHLREDALRY